MFLDLAFEKKKSFNFHQRI